MEKRWHSLDTLAGSLPPASGCFPVSLTLRPWIPRQYLIPNCLSVDFYRRRQRCSRHSCQNLKSNMILHLHTTQQEKYPSPQDTRAQRRGHTPNNWTYERKHSNFIKDFRVNLRWPMLIKTCSAYASNTEEIITFKAFKRFIKANFMWNLQ
jgi:hypothetical protein